MAVNPILVGLIFFGVFLLIVLGLGSVRFHYTYRSLDNARQPLLGGPIGNEDATDEYGTRSPSIAQSTIHSDSEESVREAGE